MSENLRPRGRRWPARIEQLLDAVGRFTLWVTLVMISLVAVNMLCQSACYLAVIFYLPVYLRFGLQMPLEKAGLMLVPVSIGIVAGAQTSIRIAARIGRLNTMPTIGMGITAVALFILALSPPEQTLIAVLGFFIGVGLGPSGPGSQMMVQTAAGPKHLGAASSVVMRW